MKTDRIAAAVAEAYRFIARAESLMEAEAAEKSRVAAENAMTGKFYAWTSTLPKECGAVRRASMDLTRALAEMRRAA